MKSKYDIVFKVRKQQFDKAQSSLNKAKQRQLENEAAYELSRKEYEKLNVLVKSGNFSQLKADLSMAQVGHQALKRAKEKVELSKKEMKHYEFLYNKAYLAYEKTKFLKVEEIKKKQKELAKNEERFLDEMAVIGFFKGEKNEE